MIKNRTIGSSAYGTHLVPLIATVMQTKGHVLELGIGDYSTPVLHEIIGGVNAQQNKKRRIISIETDAEWFNNFTDLQTCFHELLNIDYSKLELGIKYSVVFVDNAPAEDRIKAIEHLKEYTEIFVVHDTDKMKYYGYDEIFAQFKYVKTYERYRKSTTILSNSINVNNII